MARDRHRELSLAEVGERVALSPEHAQRTFRRLVGESPKQLQLRLRLEQAAVSLVSTDEAVIDVAFGVGFASHETFTRAFVRHFGHTPSAHRQLARSGTSVNSDGAPPITTGADLAASIGPCVRLCRAPLSKPPPLERKPAMANAVEIKTLPETPFLFMRRRVDLNEVAEQLAEMLPAVFGYVMEAGLPMAGPPVVRYAEQSAAFATLEAGIPLAAAAEAPTDRSGIEAGVLLGGPAAVTIHQGPYDTLGEAHAAVDRWIAANGHSAAGAPWEVYLTDPGEVPDPADWQTEVIWPVAGLPS